MNFLAHIYLSDETPESIIGNLLPDFISNASMDHFSPEIRKGMALHRKIDRFTDTHTMFLRSQKRLGNEYRLVKGIIIDIFYDHFLAASWSSFSPTPLEKYCENVYDVLLSHQSILPPRLQKALPHMIRDNWLVSYRSIEGIGIALNRMSMRLSRKTRMGESIRELRTRYSDFEKDFRSFFPELIEFVEKVKREDNSC